MNPETKLIIDEINRRFTEQDLKWDQRFANQESSFTRQIQDLEKAQDARFSALEKVDIDVNEWRASIEGTVDDVRLQVKKLSIGWERASLDHPDDKSGVFAPSPSAVPRPSAELTANSPVVGQLLENKPRVNGSRDSASLVHSPVKGEPLHHPTHSMAATMQFPAKRAADDSTLQHTDMGGIPIIRFLN